VPHCLGAAAQEWAPRLPHLWSVQLPLCLRVNSKLGQLLALPEAAFLGCLSLHNLKQLQEAGFKPWAAPHQLTRSCLVLMQTVQLPNESGRSHRGTQAG